MMSDLKTKPTDEKVEEFLDKVEHPVKRKDSFEILKMMKDITKKKPKMWGKNIVGFGSQRYKYASGREGEWFETGFSPRKQSLTLYITAGFNRYESLLKKLGKHKLGKSCLYINKLQDVDKEILKELIKESVEYVKKTGDFVQKDKPKKK
jgi:hypothetical protein